MPDLMGNLTPEEVAIARLRMNPIRDAGESGAAPLPVVNTPPAMDEPLPPPIARSVGAGLFTRFEGDGQPAAESVARAQKIMANAGEQQTPPQPPVPATTQGATQIFPNESVEGARSVTSSGIALPKEYHENMAKAMAEGQTGIKLQQEAGLKTAEAHLAEAKANTTANDAHLLRQQRIDEERDADIGARIRNMDRLSKEVVNGKVDPDRLGALQSTGNKIASAVAVGLGAIGAGLSHGPNYVFQIMESAIQNDIKAQEENIKNKRGALNEQQNLAVMARGMYKDKAEQEAAYTAAVYTAAAQKAKEMTAGVEDKNVLANSAFLQKSFYDKANEALEKTATHSSSTRTFTNVPGGVGGAGQAGAAPDPLHVERFGGRAPTKPEAVELRRLLTSSDEVTRIAEKIAAIRKAHPLAIMNPVSAASQDSESLLHQMITKSMALSKTKSSSKNAVAHWRDEILGGAPLVDPRDSVTNRILNFAKGQGEFANETAYEMMLAPSKVGYKNPVGGFSTVPRDREHEAPSDDEDNE